jgi:23S rRNA (uracil1939-C5)-methyltransferase
MISAGHILPLTIDKPAAGGRMIARTDGLVVLVSGAIPGERVRAKIERVGKGVAYASAVDIEEPSRDRRVAGGDPLCGGCLYAHIVYPRQLELKALVIADAFGRIGRLQLPASVQVVPSPEKGYRMRARLHVRGRQIGFFREGTHEVCDVRQTRQLLPATCDALDALVAAARSLACDGIREIELAENLGASQRVVYLDIPTAPENNAINVIDAVDPPNAARSLARLAATDGLTGLAAPGAVHGDVYLTDTITLHDHPAIAVRRHVLAFFQGNRYLVNQLAAHVVAQVPADGAVIDLYAGVGLFAMAAAAVRGARVTAVEGDRIAAADLAANAAATNGAVAAVHQSVEAYLDSAHSGRDRDHWASSIIVDPPRTGLSREALVGICRLGASRIVYVSCDVATLARDARGIVDSGYTLTQVDAFDLFPNTPHVETVTVFDRQRP